MVSRYALDIAEIPSVVEAYRKGAMNAQMADFGSTTGKTVDGKFNRESTH